MALNLNQKVSSRRSSTGVMRLSAVLAASS